MPLFLPISILAYALNGGAVLISKIQIQTNQLTPISYTFFGSITQGLAVFLIPFGFSLNITYPSLVYSILSGVIFVLALLGLFKALALSEASVVGPVVGGLNPLAAAILGAVFLNQFLTSTQMVAVGISVLATAIITFNQWFSKLELKKGTWWIIFSGFMFGLSYVFLREAFLQTSFINGLIISRAAAAIFALSFLLIPNLRLNILSSSNQNSVRSSNKMIFLIFLAGQIMSGISNFMLFYATSLANPALVNSLFGVQYLVILLVAIFLYKKNKDLLDETLNKSVILQKIIGVIVLSFGLYLLTK